MTIDVPTLFVVLIMVCGLIGAIFVVAWLRAPSVDMYARAGGGALLISAGLVLILLRGAIHDRLSIDLANAILLLGFGLAWTAARRFDGRSTPLPPILAGGALWLFACSFPAFYGSLGYRVALMSLICAVYSIACGYEFQRGKDSLRARRAIALLLFIHGVIVLGRAVFWLSDAAPGSMFEANFIQGLLMVEPILMVVGLTLLGLLLVRERAEKELRHSAETDHLTGALTRRALYSGAESLIARAGRDGRPVVVLLFDLDHFKAINDRFGHSVGDRTLKAFAGIARKTIRQDDLFGRIGGEEFAALLCGVEAATARLIADRIRADFSRDSIVHDGVRVPATVSVGVASAGGATLDLDELLKRADIALYEAKRSGRDRVNSAFAFAG